MGKARYRLEPGLSHQCTQLDRPQELLAWVDSAGDRLVTVLHLAGLLLLRSRSSTRWWPQWRPIARGHVAHASRGLWAGRWRMCLFGQILWGRAVDVECCCLVWERWCCPLGHAYGPETLDSEWVAKRSSSFKVNFSEAARKTASFAGSFPSECLKTLVCKGQSIKP